MQVPRQAGKFQHTRAKTRLTISDSATDFLELLKHLISLLF